MKLGVIETYNIFLDFFYDIIKNKDIKNMEKFELELQREQSEQEEVKLEDLKEGDILIVDTGDDPKERLEQYEITVVKILRTKEGKLKGLVVKFKEGGEVIIAKMFGDFVKGEEKDNLIKGVIANAKNHCLYFENLNYQDRFKETKSGKRRVRFARAIRTMPIRKIVLKSSLTN